MKHSGKERNEFRTIATLDRNPTFCEFFDKSLKIRSLKKNDQGFALVATIMLMILLVIVSLGMLSLASVTLRSSSHESARAEAQANARMALMIAIGQLQKEMGPDMRISAPADVLDSTNPPLIGVWRSWEGSDHNQSGSLIGRPIRPDYDSKETAEANDSSGRFVGWLVSGGDETLVPQSAQDLVSITRSDDRVALVSLGSLNPGDENKREVHVKSTKVGERGAYAWWVSGENQKAHLPEVKKPGNPNSFTEWMEHGSSFQSTDTASFGVDAALTDEDLAADLKKVITRRTLELLPGTQTSNPPDKAFHDFSVTSVGLLTNTATGGWRKDLSLLTETWEQQPLGGLEFFQVKPGEHIEYTRPENVAYSGIIPEEHKRKGSVFYPWSDYRIPSNNGWKAEHWHNNAAVTSWEALADHVRFYKKNLAGNLSSTPEVEPQSWDFRGGSNTYYGLHGTWAIPHIARFQIIYSYYARKPNNPDNPGDLEPALMITPVVTLWNPYNYEIKFQLGESFNARLTRALPVALKFSGSEFDNEYWAVQKSNYPSPYSGKEISKSWNLRMAFNNNQQTPDGQPAITLGPGETRVFSPIDEKDADTSGGVSPSVNMRPGLLHNGRYMGWYVKLENLLADGTTTLSPDTTMQADTKFDQNGLTNCGVRYQWGLNGSEQHGTVWAGYPREQADLYYAPPNDFPESIALGECLDNPEPFLSLVLGSKIAAVPLVKTDLDGKLTQVNRRAKGMAQSSPAIKSAEFLTGNWSDDYPGMDSLINSPWDFTYFYHSGSNDSYLQEANNTTAGGYIVTGMGASEGLSRLVMYDLPTRPLSSLGQLSSWFLRSLNPVPPQAHDIIGNSDAPPLVASNDVVHLNNLNKNSRTNLKQDDSYCANHLLFDDWFFSSIAPDLENARDLRENYLDFLTGVDRLSNSNYRPIDEDLAANEAQADGTYQDHVQPTDAWKTIASRLEVDGMFNVNSTSVEAWRGLLGHARNHRIPQYAPSGAVVLSEEVDYAFPRTEISSSDLAGAASELTAEFAGCRVFTDSMLDQFAEHIVEQVRMRGPFLSLSEFINRQLTNDEDYAVGGAIQVALNNLAKGSGSTNPYAQLQAASKQSTGNPDGNPEYAFPEAAEGYNTYGLPGWPRQADVLRPLAPILSVRDDTFTIRAYGDKRDAAGKIIARAWCEAVVQRTRDYADLADDAEITSLPKSEANRRFGRKYEIKSFRWLNKEEV